MRCTERYMAAEFETTVRRNYLVYFPNDFVPAGAKKYPLIVYLHGISEFGDDVDKLRSYGLPRALDEGLDLPCVVVAPQCPYGGAWAREQTHVQALIEESSWSVDRSRVYLIGFSLGGFGTWELAGELGPVAAAVSISGARLPGKSGSLLDVPLWAFHGDRDKVVQVEESVDAVAQLQALGGNVHLTRYPDMGHGAWSRTLRDTKTYDWLWSHTVDPATGHRTSALRK